jgi:hypothetical protein
MSRTIGTVLKDTLPPTIFGYVRDYTWIARFYVPKLFVATFVTRNPRVIWSSARADENPVLSKICSINVILPTRFCRIMTKYGSDKGRGWHNYTTVYSVLFDEFQTKSLAMLELGLGTNNPTLASSMGVTGTPGASLRGWRELFPKALVYGADIDRDILFEEERISTFYCDQTDDKSITELWRRVASNQGIDIIIDDGLHTFSANCCFLEASLSRLNASGIYIVEDIESTSIDEWIRRLKDEYEDNYPDCDFMLMELPNRINRRDNNLLVISRRCSA